MQPAQRPIIRAGNFEYAQRQQDYRRPNDQRKSDPTPNFQLRTSNFRLWPVLPAQPKKIGNEKRDEPSVAVLFVEAPFFAEMTATNKPECAESETEEYNGCSRVSMRRVLARCAALYPGYLSRVLRMQAGVSYNFCGEETCLFVAAFL